MDFYHFINSRDIEDYHRKIGYRYNALEAAWIVAHSFDTSLAKKHEAWRWIIDNMEDQLIDRATGPVESGSLARMMMLDHDGVLRRWFSETRHPEGYGPEGISRMIDEINRDVDEGGYKASGIAGIEKTYDEADVVFFRFFNSDFYYRISENCFEMNSTDGKYFVSVEDQNVSAERDNPRYIYLELVRA